MLSPEARAAADAYWARVFGCAPERLRPSGPLVVPHSPELADYSGFYLLTFGAAPVVSLPPPLLESHGARAAAAARDGLGDEARWRAVFGGMVEAVIGPAAIRYADRETLRPLPPDPDTRLLTPHDAEVFAALRRAFTDSEWEDGGSELGEHPVAGAFADRVLASIAGYEVWGEAIAHVSVVTHPAFRRRGLGAAAVSRIAAEALRRGLLAQYRALETNAPSLAIADRLGFQPYARSLAVRLAL
jgi:GNAT superfamily N-acetyltransferase